MKFKIEWHEDCLINTKHSAKILREQAERAIEAADNAEKRVAFYEIQIETAKRMKKDGFDSEKFLKKQKP